MRTVYLIRHGAPAFPEGKKVCIGRTDLPLSEAGIRDVSAMKEYFSALKPLKVFSSPLKRCLQTAESIFDSFEVLEDICEVDMGEWDGLAFDRIKEYWPEQYSSRGTDLLNVPAPGGESLRDCGHRGALALMKVLQDDPDHDVVFVTHDGLIRSMLTELEPECGIFQEKLPYASVTAVVMDDDISISYKGLTAERLPKHFTAESRERFFNLFGTPEHIKAHGRAVSAKALEMCDTLEKKGYELNRYLVETASLIHDAAKLHKHHAKVAAEELIEMGQPSLAAIVGDHMSDQEGRTLKSSNAIVFLADKLIKGETEISLETRFFDNMKPENEEFARAKYQSALKLCSELHQ